MELLDKVRIRHRNAGFPIIGAALSTPNRAMGQNGRAQSPQLAVSSPHVTPQKDPQNPPENAQNTP